MGAWQGELTLDYGRQGEKTILTRAYHRAPLKVQRPFYPEGPGCCHTVLLHTAGGIVGGDRLSTTITLAPQSHALLTTAAATKIYRSNGPESSHEITIRIGAGACLEWLPQGAIAFQGARYRQKMRVELEPGAGLIGWEVTRFGRTARGEQFLTGQWRSHLTVYQAGKLLWGDRAGLSGSRETVDHPHNLGGQPLLASFIAIGQPGSRALLPTLRAIPSEGESGLTITPGEGILGRYRGPTRAGAQAWLMALWAQLRPHYGHCPPFKMRIWA
ncbi:MAG: urease accessory protein UreD [Spirulina sp. DLM2.Bin59]|nr:MAG: urease accessory protein UreD [Spirulina sp. DLM2.Bin59]